MSDCTHLKDCYAESENMPKPLAAMKAEKRLAITFHNLAKIGVTVTLTLDNFVEAYKKIE